MEADATRRPPLAPLPSDHGHFVERGRPGSPAPAAAEPIAYTLRFPDPSTHYVEVEAQVPTGRRVSVDLFMPVWTPGSYLVRELARGTWKPSRRTRAPCV